MAFLAVRLILDRHPVVGVPVGFFVCEGDGEKGDATGDPIRSDEQGVARLPRLVPSGSYLCEVEGQLTSAVVTTVNNLREATLLPLPLGSESVATHWDDGLPEAQPDSDGETRA
jgi:hypothetical protein